MQETTFPQMVAGLHRMPRPRLDVRPGAPMQPPAVDIVVPVYNEERDLEPSILRLYSYLRANFPYTFRITIADNASTDRTWARACQLAQRLPAVEAVHLDRKGRGHALHEVWSHSDATVLAYLDVDLATDLNGLLPLLAPLLSGHSDLAIGTRLTRGSRVVRGPKREFISRGYNALLRVVMRVRFSDAQCGFKAIRADRAAELLPRVQDREWFFDTELLILAERSGLRIHEVPVDWVDDPDSRVDILDTAVKDMLGLARIARGLSTGTIAVRDLSDTADAEHRSGAPPGVLGQLSTFVVIGLLSTAAYVGLYWLLRNGMSAHWANLVALLLTAVGNTAAKRRLTFNVRGPQRRLIHQVQGLVVFGLGLVITSGALSALQYLIPGASRPAELTVLMAASALATALRFLLYRAWLFPQRSKSALPSHSMTQEATP